MNLLWQKCASGSNETAAGREFSLVASVENVCQIVAAAEQHTPIGIVWLCFLSYCHVQHLRRANALVKAVVCYLFLSHV